LKILSIDTSTDHASLALVEGELVIEEVALYSPDGVSHVLFTEVEKLLTRHAITLADVGGYASASGPGTFTGVRAGLTAVKGFAEALSKKVIAVSNLQAMAYFGTAELRAPMLDARRGGVYGALYNSALEIIGEEIVMNREAWLESLPREAEILSESKLLAGAIGLIAARAFAAGWGMDAAEIDANYVRRADAEMMWKDAR
jgi:tRNA threonylcarbamoyladenosine biosynthesis protein TsaB